MREVKVKRPRTKDSNYVLIIKGAEKDIVKYYGGMKALLKDNDLSKYEDIEIMSVDTLLTKTQINSLEKYENVERMAKTLFSEVSSFKKEDINGLAKELDSIVALTKDKVEKSNQDIMDWYESQEMNKPNDEKEDK